MSSRSRYLAIFHVGPHQKCRTNLPYAWFVPDSRYWSQDTAIEPKKCLQYHPHRTKDPSEINQHKNKFQILSQVYAFPSNDTTRWGSDASRTWLPSRWEHSNRWAPSMASISPPCPISFPRIIRASEPHNTSVLCQVSTMHLAPPID